MLSLDVSIDRSCSDLDDRTVARLCRTLTDGGYGAVTHLYLWDNRIGDAGVRSLARSVRHLPRLGHVWLGHNAIGDAGVVELCKAPMPALTRLFLDDNRIGDVGARAIARASERMPLLDRLGLHTNRIGDDGARHLAQLPLNVLWLSFNPLSARTKRQLRDLGHHVR